MEGKNYFLRHYKSDNSGWGKDVENHTLWLIKGDKEPGSMDEYEKGKTFHYCHVAKEGEDILCDIATNKALKDGVEIFHKDFDRTREFLIKVCNFLNSGKEVKRKKGHYYISEFKNGSGYSGLYSSGKMYTLNLVKTDEKRVNETRGGLGGFINKETGDIHIMEFTCFSYKMRNRRKRILQQICNACNQGIIEF
jgi:hypothetical protein